MLLARSPRNVAPSSCNRMTERLEEEDGEIRKVERDLRVGIRTDRRLANEI